MRLKFLVAAAIAVLAGAILVEPATPKFRPFVKKELIDVEGTQSLQAGFGFGWRNWHPTPDSTNPCVFRDSVGQVLTWSARRGGRVIWSTGPYVQVRNGRRWTDVIPATGHETHTLRVLNMPDWNGCGWPDTYGYEQLKDCDETKPLGADAGIMILAQYGVISDPDHPFIRSGWTCPGPPYANGFDESFWDRAPHGFLSVPSRRQLAKQRKIVQHYHEEGCLKAATGFAWLRAGSKACLVSELPLDPPDEMDHWDRWYSGRIVFDETVTYTAIK
jgi:hypothetical protein